MHFITTSQHYHTCERYGDVTITFPRCDLRFCECRIIKEYLKFVQDSEGNERKQRESPCKRETEWRAGALWSCLVWLMWLCLVCCVVSKSTRAWIPPSPWHARWLAMIISPASPPLALSSWGTYSHYSVTPSIPVVLGPMNPKSWMSPRIAGPIADSLKQNNMSMRWRGSRNSSTSESCT